MARILLSCGALLGFLSVAAGAFGAHALKSRLDPDMLAIFETAARYQMYHALALLGVGLLYDRLQSPLLAPAGGSFLAGTVIFSGSLYLLTLTGSRWLGAITPIGGVALLAGWLLLLFAVVTTRP